jgi:peptidoglycan/xylan/chitin deacetylase (PgdA/CDA1 family)
MNMKVTPSSSVRSLVKSARDAMFDVLPGVMRKGPAVSQRVALTFDDGPDHMTEQYLDLLDQLGVPATFFLIGKRALKRPDLVREYVRRGHQIAGHGYDHARFSKLSRRALLDQCARTEDALGGQLSGQPWVRPPHGTLDASSLVNLVTSGYKVAMWSLDACDYNTTDPADLIKSCEPVKAGDVLLFHEGQQWTLDALPSIVASIHAAGLECVTMHDLFAT